MGIADRSYQFRWCCALLLCVAGVGLTSVARAATFSLHVQPILSEADTKRAFTPLCEFIANIVKGDCEVRTSPNFLAYWDIIRRNEHIDFVLDAAHFTDYRALKNGYKVLVKVPDTVSYSLVVPEDKIVFDPIELAGKRVASLGQPSIGAARLNAMFPNPVRQPVLVEINDAEDGITMLRQSKVDAAILPTPIVGQAMARGGGITVVTTTEPLPHIALSVSPKFEPAMREKLRAALVKASETAEGRQMLKAIGFPRFEATTEETYANHSRVLREYWGY